MTNKEMEQLINFYKDCKGLSRETKKYMIQDLQNKIEKKQEVEAGRTM